jgi:hypothetical protein
VTEPRKLVDPDTLVVEERPCPKCGRMTKGMWTNVGPNKESMCGICHKQTQGDRLTTNWFDSHSNVVELAFWLEDQSYFDVPIDVVHLFEKPWKYVEEWDSYQADQAK